MAVRSQGVVPVVPPAPVVVPPGTPKSIRAVAVSLSPGAVGVAGKRLSVAVPGVKPADAVFVSVPGGLPLGIGIGSARASAADTVEITLLCTPSSGVTLATLAVSLIIFEM